MFFILGTAFGSFLNVVVFRFNLEEHILKNIYGRSHCMSCNKVLKWYELIPIISFLIQGGKCRKCKTRLSFQYPLVEFITGSTFLLAAYSLLPIAGVTMMDYFSLFVWLSVILILVTISVIDFRTGIIPDELNFGLLSFGIINALVIAGSGGFGVIKDGLYKTLFGAHAMLNGSFLGTVGMNLWITENLWLNLLAGAFFGGLLFGGIYFLSGGRAMGFGDVKMAIVAGFLLGFPDMVLATMLAFIIGAFSGLILILLRKKKGIKDTIPFGPFIALGIMITVFFGYDIISAYFGFFNWIY